MQRHRIILQYFLNFVKPCALDAHWNCLPKVSLCCVY